LRSTIRILSRGANPYLATGERGAEPGQYRISYGDFRRLLGWRQSVVLR
jgi:hypothetical protein